MNRDQIRQRLEYYRDLGVESVYRRVAVASVEPERPAPAVMAEPAAPVEIAPKPDRQTLVNQSLVKETQVNQTQDKEMAGKTVVAGPGLVLPSLAPENDTLQQIRADIGDCKRCRLHEQRKKVVFGSGNESARLVFVGEGPGADEDEQGLPFVGRAGQLLTQMIDNTASKEGIPITRDDVYICNVVKCRPPENRTPLPDEMEVCGQFLYRQLMTIKPKAICALGATASKALLNMKLGITKIRGEWHKWNGIPVMVTYHPSYLLRQYNQQAKREAWLDLKKLLHYVYD